eukprot:2535795-Prymnesium_polylepis.1
MEAPLPTQLPARPDASLHSQLAAGSGLSLLMWGARAGRHRRIDHLVHLLGRRASRGRRKGRRKERCDVVECNATVSMTGGRVGLRLA